MIFKYNLKLFVRVSFDRAYLPNVEILKIVAVKRKNKKKQNNSDSMFNHVRLSVISLVKDYLGQAYTYLLTYLL